MSAVTAFFLVKPTAAERKARATAKAGITKAERAAVKAYLKADPVERKAILRADGINSGKIIDMNAFRRRRRDYMRTYRAMKRMATILL
jgi:hypothetical protein